MSDTQYYQLRFEAELEAADRADDPSIAQIHRDMAGRYHDLMNGDAAQNPSAQRPVAERRAMFG